jgi:hypothetical protein
VLRASDSPAVHALVGRCAWCQNSATPTPTIAGELSQALRIHGLPGSIPGTRLLFHHAQGLTPGVQAFADTLRPAGAHHAHA